jgi:hypothetical protein
VAPSVKPADPAAIARDQATFERLLRGSLPGGPKALRGRATQLVLVFRDTWPMYRAAGPTGWATYVVVGLCVKEILEHLPKLEGTIELALDRYTPVLSLFRTASEWTAARQQLSTVAGAGFDRIDKVSEYDWKDRARERYTDSVVAIQRRAVDMTTDQAAHISNMLSAIALANVNFAIELVSTLVKVLAKVALVIAEILSVVAAPFGIQEASAVITDAINAQIDMVAQAAKHFADATNKVQGMENVMRDYRGFSETGSWPMAVDRA